MADCNPPSIRELKRCTRQLGFVRRASSEFVIAQDSRKGHYWVEGMWDGPCLEGTGVLNISYTKGRHPGEFSDALSHDDNYPTAYVTYWGDS